MKCPKCNYESGWSSEQTMSTEGEKGSFYHTKEELVRNKFFNQQRKVAFGCPNCGNVFINVSIDHK